MSKNNIIQNFGYRRQSRQPTIPLKCIEQQAKLSTVHPEILLRESPAAEIFPGRKGGLKGDWIQSINPYILWIQLKSTKQRCKAHE